MFKRTITLALFMISTAIAHGDSLSQRMDDLGFMEANPPERGSKEWRESSFSDAFIVEFTNALNIRPPKKGELRSSNVVFKAESVTYIGVNKGEFGGGLYLNAVKKDENPFFDGNIKALVPLGDDLYVIEGLAHLGFNGGSIHVIRDYNIPSQPERITLLPSAPAAVLVDEVYASGVTAIVIVGYNSFMILIPDHSLLVLHHNTFWGGLYPSSVVRYQEHWVFGIRGGVVAVPVTFWMETNGIRYFKPKAEQKHNKALKGSR